MKEKSSATVVESTVFLILLTFIVSHSQKDFRTPFHPLKIARAILPRTLSCLFVMSHHRCFGKRHQEIQVILNGPVSGQ